MSTTAPEPGQPWQPAPQYGQQPPYAQPAPHYAPQGGAVPPAKPARPSNGSILHRWPTWAQNTALAVGAVAILVVVFFAGYFTAHAIDGGTRGGFGTGQNFTPRQFGGNGGFGGQSGNGFGGQSGSGTGSGTGSGNGS
ncbi:hypothetical protein [Leifsonia shinshuensis]|uniref:Uncharacterized protein n=1 Tax=Leifsonia shinshuensis TaxID=150026 RepID=A0A7G6Y969_9MICO|nr:hypothetical protein [Leifsonia shinshuensis]QNE35034.1 hypothetical protein F1C12_07745 [Leifsonia shinshuensis]